MKKFPIKSNFFLLFFKMFKNRPKCQRKFWKFPIKSNVFFSLLFFEIFKNRPKFQRKFPIKFFENFQSSACPTQLKTFFLFFKGESNSSGGRIRSKTLWVSDFPYIRKSPSTSDFVVRQAIKNIELEISRAFYNFDLFPKLHLTWQESVFTCFLCIFLN